MLDTFREALRVLLRDVRFTAAAVSVLALTLGVMTSVYAVVRSVVLRPFPFTDQDRLEVIWQRDLRRELPLIEIAHDELTDWRARSQSFDGLAGVGSVNWSLTLAEGGEPEPIPFSAVSFCRRELAIRAAPGAGRAQLRATVGWEELWLIGGGCVGGLLGAFALGRGIGAVLVGVSPHDPLALAAAALTAASVGFIACWVPARQAADADPIETLRAE